MVCHQAATSFRLQAQAERNFGILSTEGDHVPANRSTLVTPDRSDEENIRCQSVVFRHETANAVELGAVVPCQLRVVGAGQELARLELLAPAELFRNQLPFLCHQRIPTILCGGVSLVLRSQSLDLGLDGGKFQGNFELILLSGRQCLP